MHSNQETAVLQDRTEQILNSAATLRAFIECSDSMRSHAARMIAVITDQNVDEDDRYLAATTLFEILFPDSSDGDKILGVDLNATNEKGQQQESMIGGMDLVDRDDEAAVASAMESEEALFADRLYRQMMKLGITQSDLANSTGINEPVIAMILTQECRPQKQTIRRLAAGLQISPSELWPGIDDA